MSPRQQELQKAIEYVRKTFADRRINLDYSTESVKHLDKLFEDEFKNGKLKNPDGGFAKFQGLITIGVSAYLAEVILRFAPHSRLVIDEQDNNWFLNFKVTTDPDRSILPGQGILTRIQYGREAPLYLYVLSAIKYFNDPGAGMPEMKAGKTGTVMKKPWWKFW